AGGQNCLGVGANVTGTMIRSAHEHGKPMLLSIAQPNWKPLGSWLWSVQSPVPPLPPQLGTTTIEQGWVSSQPRKVFSCDVSTWKSADPLPLASVNVSTAFTTP